MPTASGFKCPKCEFDKLADITSRDLVHIIELQCRRCGTQWAVEQAYAGGFLNAPQGKVVP